MRIPVENITRTVADMMPGDYGWTTPWMVYIDMRDTVYISGSATLDDAPMGTVSMHVRSDAQGRVHVLLHQHETYKQEGYGKRRDSDLPVETLNEAKDIETSYHDAMAQCFESERQAWETKERLTKARAEFDAMPKLSRLMYITWQAYRLWRKAIKEQM